MNNKKGKIVNRKRIISFRLPNCPVSSLYDSNHCF